MSYTGASVVVVTRDRRRLLESVLAAVLADDAAVDVVVVDDGSTDGTEAWLATAARRDGRVRAVRMPGVGAAAARQAGVEAARAPVLVLLDDDVLAEPGLIAGHLERHADVGGLVVAGYMPVGAGTDPASEVYRRTYEEHVRRCERDPREVLLHLWGGNVSLRAEDARAVGPLNPALTLDRHTDWEWGLRLLDAGMTGVFDRSLRSLHLYERSLAQLERETAACARAEVALHAAYPRLLGPFPAQGWARGPAPVRLLARVAGAPGGGAATALVRAAVRLLGRFGSRRTASRLLFAWLQMVKQRAAAPARATAPPRRAAASRR